MDTGGGRLQGIRTLALPLAALSLLVVLVSAYLRLSGAGLGCSGWPGCYGLLLSGGAHPHAGAIRILHRVTASTSLLLAFWVAWRCLRPRPLQPVARHATQLVALMILLTLVGLWSSDPHRAWASFLNMLGGLGLVALSWRLVLATAPAASRPSSPGRGLPLTAGLAALAATLALGALIGARYAALACTTAPACGGVWWPPAEGWAALSPFAAVTLPSLPGDAGGVTLHLLHRYCAVAAMLLLGAAALRAMAADATRRTGRRLLALLVVEFALGSLTLASGFGLWLAVAHSAGAAALLATGMRLRQAVAPNEGIMFAEQAGPPRMAPGGDGKGKGVG